jgi:hypothetical protein
MFLKKTCFTFFTILFVCSFIEVKGQSEPIESDWVREDSLFIESIAKAYKANPNNLEVLLPNRKERREKLGFDYYLINGSNGKGYVSIFYKVVFLKDSLIGYELHPQMPTDKRLIERYLSFYASLFKIDNNLSPEPLFYNSESLSRPLPDYYGVLPPIDEDTKFLMTPFSGIDYGKYGGFANTLLQNRERFQKVEEHFSPEICELLFYSKNPATRLDAIEYYYKNKKLFIKNKERIENRIDVIFNELPIIRTMSADMVLHENAKKLVKKISKEKL